jgi:RNA polymerase sigma-70 factor (ECF subfamily)
MTARDGGSDRFKALYETYYWRIVRFLMRAFRLSQEDAEDLAQDVFMRVFRTIEDYRGDAKWAFLETTARNLGINRVRGLKTKKRNAKTVELDDPQVNFEPEAAAGVDYAERENAALRRKQLHDAIAALPDGQRQCIQLYLDDFKYDEIARILRISPDAVKSRLRDARKLLIARLGDVELPEEKS